MQSSQENKETSEIESFFQLTVTKLNASKQEGITFVQKQRTATISKAAANGTFGSGRTFIIITGIFENHIKIRGRAIVDAISEVYQGFDFDLDNKAEDQILSFCLERLEKEKSELINEMLSNTPFKQSGHMKEDQLKRITDGQLATVDKAYNQEKELMGANINLLIRTIKMNKSKAQAGPVVNVAGDVGNLQIGDGNTLIVNESNKTAILNSFDEIRETLKGADLIEATKYQEIDALMGECAAELEKESPNKTRIGACLGAVGKTISGIATLGGAYQALKIFSPLFGGPLLP